MAAKNDEPALERVTYKPRILSLLQQIHDSRTVITVHLKDDSNRYSSAILNIDQDQNALLLDELNPKHGHDRLAKTKQLNISARLAGVNIYFKSELNSIEYENGIALYRIPIPERILYEQKRSAFRVRIGAGMVIPVSLRNPEQAIQGTLTDISSTGVGALVESGEIAIGTNFNCRISLDEGENINGELEVRFSKLDEQTKQFRIGGRFINLSPPQRVQMERFVMSLQREIIKRKKNLET
jgi:c-di-GMP-binding flagellar brake protein YcgR